MTSNKRKERLLKGLKDKRQRDAFVSAQIDTGIPFQIKVLREQKPWTQKELGEHSNPTMDQVRISILEDPNYGKITLTTLKRLASAFDVGLVVRFVPFSELVEWELNLDSESLKVLSYDEETYFQEQEEADASTLSIEQNMTETPPKAYANVVDITSRLPKTEKTITPQNKNMGLAAYA